MQKLSLATDHSEMNPIIGLFFGGFNHLTIGSALRPTNEVETWTASYTAFGGGVAATKGLEDRRFIALITVTEQFITGHLYMSF